MALVYPGTSTGGGTQKTYLGQPQAPGQTAQRELDRSRYTGLSPKPVLPPSTLAMAGRVPQPQVAAPRPRPFPAAQVLQSGILAQQQMRPSAGTPQIGVPSYETVGATPVPFTGPLLPQIQTPPPVPPPPAPPYTGTTVVSGGWTPPASEPRMPNAWDIQQQPFVGPDGLPVLPKNYDTRPMLNPGTGELVFKNDGSLITETYYNGMWLPSGNANIPVQSVVAPPPPPNTTPWVPDWQQPEYVMPTAPVPPARVLQEMAQAVDVDVTRSPQQAEGAKAALTALNIPVSDGATFKLGEGGRTIYTSDGWVVRRSPDGQYVEWAEYYGPPDAPTALKLDQRLTEPQKKAFEFSYGSVKPGLGSQGNFPNLRMLPDGTLTMPVDKTTNLYWTPDGNTFMKAGGPPVRSPDWENGHRWVIG